MGKTSLKGNASDAMQAFVARVFRRAVARVRVIMGNSSRGDTVYGAALSDCRATPPPATPLTSTLCMPKAALGSYGQLLQLTERALMNLVCDTRLLLNADERPRTTTNAARTHDADGDEGGKTKQNSRTMKIAARAAGPEYVADVADFRAKSWRVLRIEHDAVFDADESEDDGVEEERGPEQKNTAASCHRCPVSTATPTSMKKTLLCSCCGMEGHTRRTCGIANRLIQLLNLLTRYEADDARCAVRADVTALAERIASTSAMTRNHSPGDGGVTDFDKALDVACSRSVTVLDTFLSAMDDAASAAEAAAEAAAWQTNSKRRAAEADVDDNDNVARGRSAAFVAADALVLDPAIVNRVMRRAGLAPAAPEPD